MLTLARNICKAPSGHVFSATVDLKSVLLTGTSVTAVTPVRPVAFMYRAGSNYGRETWRATPA